MKVKLVGAADLKAAVPLDLEGMDAIADGFDRLAQGDVTQPPVLRIDVPEHRGEVDVKAAYVPGWDAFAVKLSSGFFDNPSRGLPSASGMMVLVASATGVPSALFLDGGYLTDLRTALAGGVAARALAPNRVRCAGLLGAGAQARWQLRAAAAVRSFPRALVWARRPEAAEEAARDLSAELDLDVRPVPSAEEVVRASDLVITTTPAHHPLIRASWLHPGLHVTAMGSDAEGKRELELAVLEAADALVVDHPPQARRLGELQDLSEAEVAKLAPRALGDVLGGRAPGRGGDADVTVADLTGTGVQDTVVARLAFARAEAAGRGSWFEG